MFLRQVHTYNTPFPEFYLGFLFNLKMLLGATGKIVFSPGDDVVRCSVAWREKKDQEKVEAKTVEVEVKVARRAAKEDKAMVRLQREGSREERRGRRRKEKRRRNGSILWIPFRKDRKEDQEIETHNGMDKEEEEEHLEERDIYMYMESQEMWRGGHRRLVQPPGIELPVSLPLTMPSSSSSSSSYSSCHRIFTLPMLFMFARNFVLC